MSVNINYNGNTIATLKNGQTGTLKCGGKLMTDDITVNVAIPEYEGEVESAVKLITFDVLYCEPSTFQAEEGMTWAQFIESEYNAEGLFGIDYNSDATDKVVYVDGYELGYDSSGDDVLPTDTIIAGHTYVRMV